MKTRSSWLSRLTKRNRSVSGRERPPGRGPKKKLSRGDSHRRPRSKSDWRSRPEKERDRRSTRSKTNPSRVRHIKLETKCESMAWPLPVDLMILLLNFRKSLSPTSPATSHLLARGPPPLKSVSKVGNPRDGVKPPKTGEMKL